MEVQRGTEGEVPKTPTLIFINAQLTEQLEALKQMTLRFHHLKLKD